MDDVIPLFDPKAVHGPYMEELHEAQARVLESGRYIGGEEVEALEAELARDQGCDFAVTCGSGTDALALALQATGCRGKIAIPALTFVGTLTAVRKAGCDPVLCDVEDDGLLATDRIGDCTFVLPVALYGQDGPSILGARVTDGCQSSRYDSISWATAISFFPTKPLGGFGDGGAVLTDNASVAQSVRELRQHGRSLVSGELVLGEGWNSRLDAVQAAMLRVVLRYWATKSGLQRLYAERYDALVEELDGVHSIATGSTRSMYPIWVEPVRRLKVRQTLRAHGVESRPYYARALSETLHGSGSCPNAENLAHSNLCLPLYPRMPQSVFERVDTALREALR
jgi:dTDP-4-amino-4,6-dideoxygalactose transaminase